MESDWSASARVQEKGTKREEGQATSGIPNNTRNQRCPESVYSRHSVYRSSAYYKNSSSEDSAKKITLLVPKILLCPRRQFCANSPRSQAKAGTGHPSLVTASELQFI